MKLRFFKLCTVILTCLAVFAAVSAVIPASAAARQNVTVTLDSTKITFPAEQPFCEDGNVLVPVRFVAEAMGYTVEWDKSSNKAMIDGGNIILNIGTNQATVKGKKVQLSNTCTVIDNRTMMSPILLTELLDVTAEWSAKDNTLNLKKNERNYSHMKIIAVVGDSHTWGEGVGAEYSFDPPCCGGELRMLPFGFPLYVNLLRNAVDLSTGSGVSEYYGPALHALCGGAEGDFGVITDKPLILSESFGFCRIFFRTAEKDTAVNLTLDGITRRIALPGTVQETNQCIRLVNVFPESDGVHTLSIAGENGADVKIHRIECYTGEYAVVNCGVGSCPVGKYLSDYYDTYVEELHPEGILFEGCTINDWLTCETPEEYREILLKMLRRMKKTTPNVLCHTVFPIAGNQFCAAPYQEYVDTMRKAAYEEGIPCVDSNRQMAELLAAVPEERKIAFLYHDIWHPNGTGHYLYAQQIFPVLQEVLLK